MVCTYVAHSQLHLCTCALLRKQCVPGASSHSSKCLLTRSVNAVRGCNEERLNSQQRDKHTLTHIYIPQIEIYIMLRHSSIQVKICLPTGTFLDPILQRSEHGILSLCQIIRATRRAGTGIAFNSRNYCSMRV